MLICWTHVPELLNSTIFIILLSYISFECNVSGNVQTSRPQLYEPKKIITKRRYIMAVYESGPILREWAPLTELFSKLPSKTQNGFFFQEVKVTCVDVLPEYLALGTNVGIVYWYDRRKKDMQRLQCENNIPITALKIVSTVDYMVACGNKSGNISIFQIPKSHSESIPENLKPKNKQVERYTVMELHKAPISAIEWSKNGMKLFSGDRNGCVVSTEIDFYMHICRSIEILNETYEVVQLSYKKQQLLVSTTYRSIICQKLDKWKVCQVGKKDRKVLGSFGGIIFQHGCNPSDKFLYCTRPGLRLWISDIEGNVQKTLLFKELLTKECPEVPIINPISQNLRSLKPQKEAAFGILLPFNEELLLTYSNDVVYILNPQEMTILSTITQLRSVLNVATHKDEIFILEEDRSLIRISYRPEPVYESLPCSEDNTFLQDITTKLQSTTSIIPAIAPIIEHSFSNDVNIHIDELTVVNAEEAQESPTETCHNPDVTKRFEEIGRQEFEDEIIFKKSKHRKKPSNTTISTSSLSSEEKELSYTRSTIMNLSAVGILPDLRSPESINYDIENKEKILADILNLDRVKLFESKDSALVREENDPEKKNIVQCVTNYDLMNNIKTERLCRNSKGSTPENKNSHEITYRTGRCDDVFSKNLKDDVRFKNQIPQNQVMSKNENDINIERINSEDDPILKRVEISGEQSIDSKMPNEMPACMNIPNDWRLSDIQVRERTVSGLSDNSLSDWEIV